MLALSALRSGLENYEVATAILFDFHDTGFVAHAIGVVWCWPNGHKFVVEPVLVALLHKLMRSCYEVQSVNPVELVDHLSSK